MNSGNRLGDPELPYWRPILLDGYASTWAEAARTLHSVGIAPSCSTISEKIAAMPRGENNKEMNDWEDLRFIEMELHRSFALSIGALWERNFRRHLRTSAAIIENPASKALIKIIQRGSWDELCKAFKRVRNFDLNWFPQYKTLYVLNLVTSAIRHGDGPAAEALANLQPDLFLEDSVRTGLFAYFNGEYLNERSVSKLYVPLDKLTEFTEAVATFWETVSELSQSAARRKG